MKREREWEIVGRVDRQAEAPKQLTKQSIHKHTHTHKTTTTTRIIINTRRQKTLTLAAGGRIAWVDA